MVQSPIAMHPAANDMAVHVPAGIRIQKVAGGMDKIQEGGDGGYGLYADANFTKGEDVYKYPSEPWPRDRNDPGKLADTVDLFLSGPSVPPESIIVRITPLEHGELYADGTVEISGFDMICNHCCDANMYYDEERSTAVAARDIKVGEELTVNYNCHNWDETSNLLTFDCADFCKTPLCCRTVKGFKYLPPQRQQELVEQGGCSEYVLEQWNQTKSVQESTSGVNRGQSWWACGCFSSHLRA
jgi:hypothetical protein